MLDDKIKRIIEFIAREAECESGFLYPNPQWYLFSVPLLDEIKEVYGCEAGEIGAIFNPIREEVEATKEIWEDDEGTPTVAKASERTEEVKPKSIKESERTKELKKLFKKP